MLYTKTIAGRQVFSDCRTIQLEFDHDPLVAGQYVSNPSAELIAAEGWVEYVPPVVPPQPQTEPYEADIVEAIKKMLAPSVEELTDEEALEVAALYPTWASKIGQPVTAGERLWYDTKLYKVIQAHTVQEEWTPDITPALFVEVSIEEWPAWVQPTGAQDAYMSGDKVTHNDLHWECTVDYNVYEPGVYGWTQLN